MPQPAAGEGWWISTTSGSAESRRVLPRRPRRRLARPVAGGRCSAVAAVPSHLPSQFCNARLGRPQQFAQRRLPLPQLGVLGRQLEVLRCQPAILHFPLRDSVLRRDHALNASWGEGGALTGRTSRGQYSMVGSLKPTWLAVPEQLQAMKKGNSRAYFHLAEWPPFHAKGHSSRS